MFTLVFWGSLHLCFGVRLTFFSLETLRSITFFSKPILILRFVLFFEKPENNNKRNGTFGYDSLNLSENFTKKKGNRIPAINVHCQSQYEKTETLCL